MIIGRQLKALLGFLLLFLLAVLHHPFAASAHAYVVVTSPQTNGTVTASPPEVSVSFDEPVTIESQNALIVQGNGSTAVCAGGAKLDPDDETRVVCKIAAPLQRGEYQVFWRVTSADTHVVHGVFSFGVGVAVNAPAGEIASIYDPSGALAGALRWLTLLGVAALIGAIVFERFVLSERAFSPGALAGLARLRRSCAMLRFVGVWIAIVAGIGSLDVQAAAATGTDLVRAIPSVGSIAIESTWGVAWLVRTAVLIVLALLPVRRPTPAMLLLGAIVLLTLSVSGHAVASGRLMQSLTAVAIDWLHLCGAAVWAGGLAVFAFGIRSALRALEPNERFAFVQRVIARFSPLAIGAVAVIVASGVYAGIAHIGTAVALVATLYGRVVIAKAVLLLPLLALGYRHYRQGRTLERRAHFASTVTCEAVIIVAVLALSATLNGLAPPFPTGGFS